MVNCPTGRTASHALLTDIPIENLTKDAPKRFIEIEQDYIANLRRFLLSGILNLSKTCWN